MASIDTSDATFQRDVLEASQTRPILVDFWAPWCGPCRMLGPVLEAIVAERTDFTLAKLNTDENPQTASQYRISGIPDVRLFVAGEMVGQFQGALPRAQIERFLEEHLPSPAKERLAEGMAHLRDANLSAARESLTAALELDQTLHAARIELGALILGDGDVEILDSLLSPIPPTAPEYDRACAMRALAAFAGPCKSAGGLEGTQAKVASSPDDAQTLLDHGRCLALQGRFEEALEALLASLIADRKVEDDAARLAILSIFEVIGIRTELANRIRRKMSLYL